MKESNPDRLDHLHDLVVGSTPVESHQHIANVGVQGGVGLGVHQPVVDVLV